MSAFKFKLFFSLGLLVKLIFLFLFVPIPITDWYAPFLSESISVFTLDPWSSWIESQGSNLAFPYGYAMWLTLLPASIFCKFLGFSLISGYKFTLLFADLILFGLLRKLIIKKDGMILYYYWLSPIVIFAIYGLGLNDIIPALFLSLSLFYIQRNQLKWSGFFSAIAISAKISMGMALPFVLIYLYVNKSLRADFLSFLKAFIFTSLVLFAPFMFSPAAIKMLFQNPEILKVLNLTLKLNTGIVIYIVPLIYVLMTYFFWKLKRLNFDLLFSAIGITFFMVLLFIPHMLGWFLWCIPFLINYQSISGRITAYLILLFSSLYLFGTLLVTPLKLYFNKDFLLESYLEYSSFEIFIQTSIFILGFLLIVRFWREAFFQSDFYRLSRKPFLVGISGDSASGKDTFVINITKIFGESNTTKVSGDDYHLWDRHKPMWKFMTHLNPMANDLERFMEDIIFLKDGKEISSRKYDHISGKLKRFEKAKSNDLIVVSGLHTLTHPLLRECFDLKVFLDIDENLRKLFKLKRDTTERKKSKISVLNDLKARKVDSIRFIKPQIKYADLIFSIQTKSQISLKKTKKTQLPSLRLVVTTKDGLNMGSLYRTLIGICGLHVDFFLDSDGWSVMTIEGDVKSEDIKLASEILCKRFLQFLDASPEWQDGISGLMQLVSLYHINQLINKRLL
jgi:uridine kinase